MSGAAPVPGRPRLVPWLLLGPAAASVLGLAVLLGTVQAPVQQDVAQGLSRARSVAEAAALRIEAARGLLEAASPWLDAGAPRRWPDQRPGSWVMALRDGAGAWAGAPLPAAPLPVGTEPFALLMLDGQVALVRRAAGTGGQPAALAPVAVLLDGAEARLALRPGETTEARSAGLLSGGPGFTAIRPVAGTGTSLVVEVPPPAPVPVPPAARAVAWGAAAAAGLALLAWLAAAALIRRGLARLEAHRAELRREGEAQATRAVDRFFAGLPATVYRGELFPDGTLLPSFVSEGIALFGGPSAEAALEPGRWRASLDEDGQAALDAMHRGLLEEGEAVAEYALRRGDGTRLWLRDRARVTGRGPNGFAEVAGMITDVTGERLLGERANQASKLATLGKMATSIAHELTQPLGAITIASETTLATLPDGTTSGALDATRRRIGRIGQQAERASRLVDQLRTFGRQDAGPPEPVPVRAAIEGALTLAEPALLAAGVEVVVRVEDGLPPVRGRRLLLEHVLVNLLINARDAMAQQPEETRRVEIRAEAAEGGLARLAVQDHGPGFPPAILERVFDPFVTTKPMGRGTGLGLSICQGTVEGFGGRVEARNTDMGACVVIELPAWQPALQGEEASR